MRHSFFRCTAIFILILSLGVGTAWASGGNEGTTITVYATGEIAWASSIWDKENSTIRIDVRRKGDMGDFSTYGNAYLNAEMTNTGYTYNGYTIYSYTFKELYDGAEIRFKHYKSGEWQEDYGTGWGETTTINGKIYRGYYSDAFHWITYGRDVTFYATPEKMDGSKWKEGTHSLFANFKYGDGDSEWKRQQMTKTAYTYNGNAIYTCTMLLPYNVIKKVQFLYNDGSDQELYAYDPSPQLTANDLDGKILLGWNGSSHNWVSYGRDVTIYTIPDYLFKDFKTPYNESIHYPAVCIQMGTGSTWNTVNMTKTSYKYATYPIYKATILIDQNKFWEFQIKYLNKSGDTQVDLYQFNNSEPKTEYAPSYIDDKLYHGWNGKSHDFFSYRYDVALDMQSGGGGSTSIIAIDGSAMPSATMPGRDGYEFDGYWTEPNGGGTQYYNSNGSSTRNWDSRTITTLYAKWTARNYTVTLEGMEADGGNVPIDVVVTYDSVLPPLEKKHTKAHYKFLGYWPDNDDKGATLDKDKQLIDKDGNWIKSIDPYTGANGDKATWIYPKIKSLFAQWEEIKYTVNVAVSPAEAGSVQVEGVPISKIENVGFATHSPVVTAVPSNAEWWVFKEWSVSDTTKLRLELEYHSQYDPDMEITARGADQKLTANFTYRYSIKGTMNGENWETDHFVANIKTTGRKDIGYVDIDLPANTSYQFAIYDLGIKNWYRNGSDKVYSMTNGNSYNWSFATEKAHNCGITTAGAGTYRFIWNITDKTMSVIYPNFVIYRTGDQGEDSESATHTITTPVESYLGGTISEAIEFRMKVRELDKWYTLCLPFEVNKVCVWDNVDGAYYDIVPYYRTGGKFYTGHYIIREPLTTNDFAIEGFEGRDRWIDPASSDVLPSKNIPYIIQWHDSYFDGKYISFFSPTGQTIPYDFSEGEAPSENDVVNIFGNNTMHSGTVRDAYLLDKDYGPSGAWLREAIGTDRKILPFECFIRANDATTTRYRILRRGMEETDTPTALEQISNHQSPMTIRVYTITGVLIGEYNDCSFQDAAHRIATDYNEGIYILRSENESMKLLLGGK